MAQKTSVLQLMNVRFEGNNGHDANVTRCLLMTLSGHREHDATEASWGTVRFNSKHVGPVASVFTLAKESLDLFS